MHLRCTLNRDRSYLGGSLVTLQDPLGELENCELGCQTMQLQKDSFQEIISLTHEANEAFVEGRTISVLANTSAIKTLAN